MDRDFAFDLYRDSWKRRNQLTSELSFPAGILTLLWGSLILLMRSASWDTEFLAWSVLLAFLFAVACTMFARAVWYLVRVYHGYEYAKIPMTEQLLAYEASIASAYSAVEDGEAAAHSAFEKYLVEVLGKATDLNEKANEQRAERLHRMRRAVALCTLLTFLCALPWLAMQLTY
jgi:hypothetical protein